MDFHCCRHLASRMKNTAPSQSNPARSAVIMEINRIVTNSLSVCDHSCPNRGAKQPMAEQHGG